MHMILPSSGMMDEEVLLHLYKRLEKKGWGRDCDIWWKSNVLTAEGLRYWEKEMKLIIPE